MKSLEAAAQEQQRNQEAESAYVRKNVWDENQTQDGEEDMGNMVLGDITNPAPVIVQPPQNNINSLLLAAVISAGAAAGGYFFGSSSRPPYEPQAPQSIDDESVSLGLGRIEDYLSR